MTAIIFLTYPGNWPNETLPWTAMALAIMAFGPGRTALDRFVAGSSAAEALAPGVPPFHKGA